MKTAKPRALFVLVLWLVVAIAIAAPTGFAYADGIVASEDGQADGEASGDPDMPDTSPPKSSGSFRVSGWESGQNTLEPLNQRNIATDPSSGRVFGWMWAEGVLRILKLYLGW